MTSALLLMDVQNEIVSRFAASADYLDRAVAAQERAEAAGVPVILVRVAFEPGHPEIADANPIFGPAKQRGAMVLGTEGVEPHPRLRRGRGEIVVTKKRVSAFAGSPLETVLSAHGVDHLVLGGIATSGVVLSTVRAAADRDYRLTVLADLCLDADSEVHRVLTTKVFPRQAEVIDSGDWRP
jgi:nicotinamidase-related amidase